MEHTANAIVEKPMATGCRHHWIIETPNGPVSKGVCKLCGEERDFENIFYGQGQVYEHPKSTSLRDLVDMEDDWGMS
jgi:hypothetical protein